MASPNIDQPQICVAKQILCVNKPRDLVEYFVVNSIPYYVKRVVSSDVLDSHVSPAEDQQQLAYV